MRARPDGVSQEVMKPWRRVSGFLPSIKQYIRSTPLQYSTAKWRTLKLHAAALELAKAEKREEDHGEEEVWEDEPESWEGTGEEAAKGRVEGEGEPDGRRCSPMVIACFALSAR